MPRATKQSRIPKGKTKSTARREVTDLRLEDPRGRVDVLVARVIDYAVVRYASPLAQVLHAQLMPVVHGRLNDLLGPSRIKAFIGGRR